MTKVFLARSCNVCMFSCLASAVLLFAVSGCGRSTEVKGPEGEKASVEHKDDGLDISVKGKDGEESRLAIGESVSLPDDFPKDVPIYPEAKVIMSMSVEKGSQVTLSTEDSADKVEAFYKERMKKDGWEEKLSMNLPVMKMLGWEKDGRELMINVIFEEGKTMINITVPEKKDK